MILTWLSVKNKHITENLIITQTQRMFHLLDLDLDLDEEDVN